MRVKYPIRNISRRSQVQFRLETSSDRIREKNYEFTAQLMIQNRRGSSLPLDGFDVKAPQFRQIINI
jgi:hypothetical protein